MLLCFLFTSYNWKNIPFTSMVYINESVDVNTAKKTPSNLWVVSIGSNNFQGISYAGKPQVVSSYSFKSMVFYQTVFKDPFILAKFPHKNVRIQSCFVFTLVPWVSLLYKETAHFQKCKQLLEYQHLLLIRDIWR